MPMHCIRRLGFSESIERSAIKLAGAGVAETRKDDIMARAWFLSRTLKRAAYGACLLLVTLAPMAARAATCAFDAGQSFSPTAIVNLTGSITVGRDLPVGTAIYTGSFHGQPTQARITCDSGNNDRDYTFVSLPHPKSSYVDPTYGNNVYETGVPGVGVVVWVNGRALPLSVTTNTAPGTNFILSASRWFDFTLIKTGNVSAGTIRGSDIPGFDYRIGTNRLLIESGRYSGALNIVAQTCITPDVSAPLGDYVLNALGGVGTSTPARPVSVRLNQCPAFYGQSRREANNEPSAPSVSVTSNMINYRIDATGPVLDAANGIVALAAGGATGMGVQILDSAGAPIPIGRMRPSNLSLNMSSGGDYVLALQARYYQVNAVTTPGQANASVTMTLEYL